MLSEREMQRIFTRLKNYATVMVPLLLSSFNRIEVVSTLWISAVLAKIESGTWYHRKEIFSCRYDLCSHILDHAGCRYCDQDRSRSSVLVSVLKKFNIIWIWELFFSFYSCFIIRTCIQPLLHIRGYQNANENRILPYLRKIFSLRPPDPTRHRIIPLPLTQPVL